MGADEARRPSRIVVASGNAHKVAELRAMLRDVDSALDVIGMAELGDPPVIDETAPDFHGNAVLKAEGIAAWLRSRGEPGPTAVLADDSGICVDALAGAPGVRSARFSGEGATDESNNRALVAALHAAGVTESPAHYDCVLALARVDGRAWPGETEAVPCFEGRWHVKVRVQARGTGGFGYDPHAWLDDDARTVAELGPREKAARSHRGQALRALAAWLGA
jgi:XTP/dITP diphosphohydrolase